MEHGAHPADPGVVALTGVDCPDGLARCREGEVQVSRLAKLAQPCRGPESACSCPWDPVAFCARGCLVDGLEMVMDEGVASTQLCSPEVEAGLLALPPRGGPGGGPGEGEGVSRCDEGVLYRCDNGALVDCGARSVIARCLRGCSAREISVDGISQSSDGGAPVQREVAFAILCSH